MDGHMIRLLFVCAALVIPAVATVLSLVERRREARSISRERRWDSAVHRPAPPSPLDDSQGMEFGVVNGPRFQRCATCGHVRHG